MKADYTDYTDTYTTTVRNARRMTAPDLFHLMFVRYPNPSSTCYGCGIGLSSHSDFKPEAALLT